MGNQPLQTPNIDLPGSEYLSLAPNHAIAIQGRRRINITASASIPAGGVGSVLNGQTIENPFPAGAGIYIANFNIVVAPQDTSGELQLTALQTGFGLNPGATPGTDVFFRIGVPFLTLQAVTATTLATSDRDLLLLQRDIAFYETVVTLALVCSFSLEFKNNDSTNAHTMAVGLSMLYTRLDGVLE